MNLYNRHHYVLVKGASSKKSAKKCSLKPSSECINKLSVCLCFLCINPHQTWLPGKVPAESNFVLVRVSRGWGLKALNSTVDGNNYSSAVHIVGSSIRNCNTGLLVNTGLIIKRR